MEEGLHKELHQQRELHTKHRSRNGSAEDSCEPSADTADDQFISIMVIELDQVAKKSQSGANCAHGPSFPAEPPVAKVTTVATSFTGTTSIAIFPCRIRS
jgi:hypothetical protein